MIEANRGLEWGFRGEIWGICWGEMGHLGGSE